MTSGRSISILLSSDVWSTKSKEAMLRPHGRGLDRHAARAPHQEQFQIDILVRAVGVRLRPHADQAIAQAALQRADALPFQAIERVAVWMTLYHRNASELLAPI